MTRAMWDPEKYGEFAAERSRPFFDLVERVGIVPRSVVDLGCGPATLTATLLDRWPGARITGVDSSPEMVAAALACAMPGRLEIELADLRTWRPAGPVDLVVSNAALQWVPEHRSLLPELASFLAPGGVLAFQVPGNFTAPSHTVLDELCESPRWRDRLGGRNRRKPASAEPEEYLKDLDGCGLSVEAWETTYLHVLRGDDPVVEWLRGTALRPVLAALGPDAEAFCAELAPRLRRAYPARSYGTVLPYRRIFAIGRALGHSGRHK